MRGEQPTPRVDRLDDENEALGERLKVLANASRLRLLRILQQPHCIDEIQLSPGPTRAWDSPGRPVSRQAVDAHLQRLLGLGLVKVRRSQRPEREGRQEYVLDEAGFFAVVESLRQLGDLRPLGHVDPAATAVAPWTHTTSMPAAPRLIVVHGARIGTAFPLHESDRPEGRGWIIGRAPHAQVHLGYDPYVSSESAEILGDGGAFEILDLRTAKNRVLIDGSELPLGGRARLHAGAIVGVGGSLLVFQP